MKRILGTIAWVLANIVWWPIAILLFIMVYFGSIVAPQNIEANWPVFIVWLAIGITAYTIKKMEPFSGSRVPSYLINGVLITTYYLLGCKIVFDLEQKEVIAMIPWVFVVLPLCALILTLATAALFEYVYTKTATLWLFIKPRFGGSSGAC